jgi:hypothetical protein
LYLFKLHAARIVRQWMRGWRSNSSPGHVYRQPRKSVI